ncbi:MAG: hypothetical protein H8F28_13460 [Fibrella sp.]|nr:hypothetical protein [Armatimonadota bacterium]
MKYTPTIAALVVITGLATAFHVQARESEPRYNLDFAFGTENSMRVEVGATDTFHVVTRRGKESYEVRGSTVYQNDKVAARITTLKEVRTPVTGPDNRTADSAVKSEVSSVIFLTPGGDPVSVGGSNEEPFTLKLSPVEVR